jgi:microcystin-dependent protein
MNGIMAYIGLFAGHFAPKFFMSCDGQILSIGQNQALFSLLGTTYGGDGITTFGLPDLRGRTAISAGQGIGLPNYVLGQRIGQENVTLTSNNLPPHNHNGNVQLKLAASPDDALDATPNDAFPGRHTGAYSTTTDKTMMKAGTIACAISDAGGSQPLPVRAPYLALIHVICVAGIYPSRN